MEVHGTTDPPVIDVNTLILSEQPGFCLACAFCASMWCARSFPSWLFSSRHVACAQPSNLLSFGCSYAAVSASVFSISVQADGERQGAVPGVDDHPLQGWCSIIEFGVYLFCMLRGWFAPPRMLRACCCCACGVAWCGRCVELAPCLIVLNLCTLYQIRTSWTRSPGRSARSTRTATSAPTKVRVIELAVLVSSRHLTLLGLACSSFVWCRLLCVAAPSRKCFRDPSACSFLAHRMCERCRPSFCGYPLHALCVIPRLVLFFSAVPRELPADPQPDGPPGRCKHRPIAAAVVHHATTRLVLCSFSAVCPIPLRCRSARTVACTIGF